jgi:hypothetical protein
MGAVSEWQMEQAAIELAQCVECGKDCTKAKHEACIRCERLICHDCCTAGLEVHFCPQCSEEVFD